MQDLRKLLQKLDSDKEAAKAAARLQADSAGLLTKLQTSKQQLGKAPPVMRMPFSNQSIVQYLLVKDHSRVAMRALWAAGRHRQQTKLPACAFDISLS